MRYRGEPYPRVVSIASTLIRPSRSSPVPVSPLMSSMGNVKMTLASVSSSDENFLGKNTGAAEGKRESRALEEHFESRGKRWCCKSKSPEWCDHDSDLKTTVGIRVSDR